MNDCLLCDAEIVIPTSWKQVLFPKKNVVMCEKCKSRFQKISDNVCMTCGRDCEEEKCYDCVRWSNSVWKDVLKKNISLYCYNDEMKEMIARWKFRGDIVLVDIFREEVERIGTELLEGIDMIVPIPLSEERLYTRGFNQSVEIARLLGEFEEILYRVHSEKQSKKNRQERIESDNVFGLLERKEIEGLSILLVDDIYTTGMTLRHAAKILMDNGAKVVTSFTIAR